MPTPHSDETVRALDLVLEFFGNDGRNWHRGGLEDGHGNRCVLGALNYVAYHNRLPTHVARKFLEDAAYAQGIGDLIPFNDILCPNFAEMRAIILKARDTALAASRETDRPKPGNSRDRADQPKRVPPAPKPIPGQQGYLADLSVPLAILPYLKPKRLAELRATAPGSSLSPPRNSSRPR